MIAIVILIMCLVTMSIRRMEGSWYSPAALFGLLWTVVTIFSVISASDYYFSPSALGYILFNIILFFTGGKIYELAIRKENRPTTNERQNFGINGRWILSAGIISGWIATFLLIYYSDFSFLEIFDTGKLMNLSNTLTEDRYYGSRLSPLIMLCLAVSYLASFFAGAKIALKANAASRIWLALLIAPIVVFTLIYTARAVTLFMLFILIASYIAFRPYNLGPMPRLFTRNNIIAMILGFVVLFSVFFLAQAARMQVEDIGMHQAEMLWAHLRVWFSGNISAFCIWFDSSISSFPGNQGSNTFAGLMELLGMSQRKLGIYDIATDVNGKMEFSNIYTLFRFLIDDFGFIGSGIIIFFCGAAARKLYLDSINRTGLISSALLAGIVMMILWSFITSAFAYNTTLFAWIGFVITLKFSEEYGRA